MNNIDFSLYHEQCISLRSQSEDYYYFCLSLWRLFYFSLAPLSRATFEFQLTTVYRSQKERVTKFWNFLLLTMAILSKNIFECFESARAFCVQMPTIEQNPQISSSSWHSMFVFTRGEHGLTIAIALISTFASALFRPTAATFFGKIFSALTQYGAGTASPENTVDDFAKWCTALAALGCSAWIVKEHFCPPGWRLVSHRQKVPEIECSKAS